MMTGFSRWITFMFGLKETFHEHIVTLDLTDTWRRHLVWAKKSGGDLKEIVTGRYSSATVFLSLLFSTEMGVLYSPSMPADQIREALANKYVDTVEFWAGMAVCVSIFFSVAALVANFTAWSVFSSLSKENSPIILRSTIGLYAAQLPSRLVTCAIYLFFTVVVLSWWVVMPPRAAIVLSVCGVALMLHIINIFSSIARVILLTSAMSEMPILDYEDEEKLTPAELSDALLRRSRFAQKLKFPVKNQYRLDYQELLRDAEDGKVRLPLTQTEIEVRCSKLQMKKRSQEFRVSTPTIIKESKEEIE